LTTKRIEPEIKIKKLVGGKAFVVNEAFHNNIYFYLEFFTETGGYCG
jgi:hypothetical protein